MNSIGNFIISLGKIALVIGVIFLAIFYLLLPDMCDNYLHSEIRSPNGELKAVIFQRDCGATTGFSTQVSILDSSDTLDNDSGNIFAMKGHPDDVAPRITWTSNSELKIQSSSTNRQYFAKSSYGWFNKLHISYGE